MKNQRRLLSFIMSFTMAFSCAGVAFAADNDAMTLEDIVEEEEAEIKEEQIDDTDEEKPVEEDFSEDEDDSTEELPEEDEQVAELDETTVEDENNEGNEDVEDDGIATLASSTVTCGFYPNNSSDGVKRTGCSSRNSDGTNTYVIKFFCDGTESWIDSNITFKVENVTPTAYMEMFNATGISTLITSTKITSGSVYFDGTEKSGLLINSSGQFEVPGVVNSSGEFEYSGKYATSGKKITVNAGAGVRAIKVTAVKSGTVLDTVYMLTSGKDSSGNYSDYDEQFYEQFKKYVEDQLWTSGMTNREKLTAMANYINTTTHYSGSDATSKDTNPDYRKRWVVDGQDFYLVGTDWGPLSGLDDLQGGIGTCMFAYSLEEYAEDMGLKNLKDSKTGDIASGEGVWVGCGSESSNPSNPGHCTLIYQSSNGTKSYFDVQGMRTVCSVHDCSSKIIPLNFTFKYTPSTNTKSSSSSTSNTSSKSNQTLTAKAKKTSITVGKTTTITASGKGTITYTSSNKKIVTVSSKGTVTAKSPGKATITVKAAGNSTYKSASKKITIKVIPKSTSLKSLKNTKGKKATVKWKKVSGVTGYQVQYSTSKSFKSGNKSTSVKGASKTSKTLSKLKKGKTYYVRVRTYKTVSGTKYYSSWSSAKKVKISK